MPELPEVETVKRALSRTILNKRVMEIEADFKKIVASPGFEEFRRNIIGRTIKAITRRGKFLLFHFSGDKIMVSHLRMTGHWLVLPQFKEDKFTHLLFTLSGGQIMAYSDIRKFGRIWLIDKEDLSTFKPILKLGPEPLGDSFILSEFGKELDKSKGKIKVVLLNQRIVAGLGNIYVDEVLFIAGISPDRPANKLSFKEKGSLFNAIRKILAKAIDYKGTTVVNFTTPEGKGGEFQKHLQVYGKKGKNCPRCKAVIRRIVIAGRGTHYCSGCQK